MPGKIKSQKFEEAQSLKTITGDKDCPAFTFQYIINNSDYNLDSKISNDNLKCSLLHSLHKYSKIPWDKFNGDKRRTGVETIGLGKLRKLKVSLPNTTFYNSVKNVTIFRVSDKARIVGWRYQSICYILWIDWDFSSYDHGS